MSNITTVTAADVRSFFLADEKRMSALSESAQANVRAVRGRLSGEVVEVHNSRRRTRKYVQGATAAAKAQGKAEAAAAREALRAQGVPVGARGRLPKAPVAE